MVARKTSVARTSYIRHSTYSNILHPSKQVCLHVVLILIFAYYTSNSVSYIHTYTMYLIFYTIFIIFCMICMISCHAQQRNQQLDQLSSLASLSNTSPSSSPSTTFPFIIRVNTFKRPQNLELFLQHYTSCSTVYAIQIIWSEPDNPPKPLSSYRIPVEYEIHSSTSLTNRFLNTSYIPSEAILSLDDDVIIPCHSIHFAFQVWQANSNTLVGISPRLHGTDPISGDSRYYRWQHTWWNGFYSIVLTKACFLHSKYLVAYANLIPSSMNTFIDMQRNGEDLAMAFIVAMVSGAPPVWVKVDATEMSGDGISSGGVSHFHKR